MRAGTCLALLALLSTPALAENNLRDPFVRSQPDKDLPDPVVRTLAEQTLRDPFVRPQPVASCPSRPELRVTGVLQSEDHYVAIVQFEDETRILLVGDAVADSRVLRITPEGVTLMSTGADQQVRLGEKDLKLSFQYAWSYELPR